MASRRPGISRVSLFAFALAYAIGFSRVYLGVHWASDVIAGWAVGGVSLSAAILASRSVHPDERVSRA